MTRVDLPTSAKFRRGISVAQQLHLRAERGRFRRPDGYHLISAMVLDYSRWLCQLGLNVSRERFAFSPLPGGGALTFVVALGAGG